MHHTFIILIYLIRDFKFSTYICTYKVYMYISLRLKYEIIYNFLKHDRWQKWQETKIWTLSCNIVFCDDNLKLLLKLFSFKNMLLFS